MPIVDDLWVEVGLEALKHNFRQVRGTLPDSARIMAVVKANGYGHGEVEPARAFVEAGADALAVTRLEEGLRLRQGGLTSPLLLLAPMQPENASLAVEADLQCAVDSLPLAQALSAAAVQQQKTARLHVKIDSGMGRLGVLPDDAPGLFSAIRDLPGLQIAGTFTHFATAMEADLSHCRQQLARFDGLLKTLRAAGTELGCVHAANSAALLRLPESRYDMVRAGTLLYGQYPSAHVPKTLDLKPTWRLKARVCSVKELPAGSPVGYGGDATTRRKTRAAVLPVGYTDGFTLVPEGPLFRQPALKLLLKRFTRSLSVQIRGQSAPVLGRVAMQMCVVDVTDIPVVEVGDEAIIPAMRIATNSNVPRVYL